MCCVLHALLADAEHVVHRGPLWCQSHSLLWRSCCMQAVYPRCGVRPTTHCSRQRAVGWQACTSPIATSCS
jgi:hypothetical protein